jgi:DNA-binding NarL/FixJ family response regulator
LTSRTSRRRRARARRGRHRHPAAAAIAREIAAIRRRFPNAGIVILAKTLDSADLLAAMRMGANEWVSEPLVHDELVAAIRELPGSLTRESSARCSRLSAPRAASAAPRSR